MTIDIIKRLQNYDDFYAQGKPKISDAAYDKLREKAKLKYSNNPYFEKVGGKLTNKTNGRIEVKLPVRMGSLHKKRPAEVIAWLNKMPKYASYYITPKYDGISILLVYKNRKFHRAYTRGENGVTGFDVTKNIKHVQGVLPQITRIAKHSPSNGTLYIKAECICHLSIFNKYFSKKIGGKYKNPRNFVIGLVNTLKQTKELKKTLRKLTVVCYGLSRIVDGKPIYHEHKRSEIYQLGFHGFTTVIQPTRWPDKLWRKLYKGEITSLRKSDYPPQMFKEPLHKKFYYSSIKELSVDLIDEILKINRNDPALDVDQDGLVIEIDEHKIRKTLGWDDARPQYAFAIKPEVENQESKIGTIKHIEWSLTKRRLLKPVIILKKKLEFKGVEVDHISAFNAAFVKKHKLVVGKKVKIIRSGDTIPRVLVK